MDIKNGLTDKKYYQIKINMVAMQITNTKKNSFISLLIESLGDPIIRILLIALGIKTIFLIKDFDWYETVGIVIAIFLSVFYIINFWIWKRKSLWKVTRWIIKNKMPCKKKWSSSWNKCWWCSCWRYCFTWGWWKNTGWWNHSWGRNKCWWINFNGESKEKYKYPNHNNINDDHNTVYRGTVVYSKEAIMLVTKVGNETVYGKIAAEIARKTTWKST